MRLASRLIVLASCAAAVVFAWSWSRGYVAHGIGDRAARQPASARSAMSELGQLGAAGVPALLDAAISPDRAVAVPARRQVESLLMRWAARPDDPLDAEYLLVIEGLLRREPQLTPSGRRWARQLGDTALRLAESTRESIGPELVSQVERLFAVAQGISQVSDLPLPLSPALEKPVLTGFGPRPVDRSTSEPLPTPSPALLEQPDVLALQSSKHPLVVEPPAESGIRLTPEEVFAQTAPLPPAMEASPGSPQATGPSALPWRRPQGVTPLARSKPSVRPGAQPEPRPKSPAVQDLLAGSDADKLRLIEQLLSGQHADAAALLFDLAKDPAPRVRASAISALGSSPNSQLTQAAWRLAITDEDPKVARLAIELQKLLR